MIKIEIKEKIDELNYITYNQIFDDETELYTYIVLIKCYMSNSDYKLFLQNKFYDNDYCKMKILD